MILKDLDSLTFTLDGIGKYIHWYAIQSGNIWLLNLPLNAQ